LYEYIPETYRQQDSEANGLLETYAESLRPSFDELRHQIRSLEDLRDPLTVRTQYTEVETLKLGPVVLPIGELEQRGPNGRVDALNQFIALSARFTDRSVNKEITLTGSVFPQNNRTVTITSVVNSTTVVTDPVLVVDTGPLSWEVRPKVDIPDDCVTVKIRSGDVAAVKPGWVLNDGFADFTVIGRRQLPTTSDALLYLTDREGIDGTINSSGNLVAATINLVQSDVGKLVSFSTSSVPENNNRWEILEIVSSTVAIVADQEGNSPTETGNDFFWAILPHADLILKGTNAPSGVIEEEGLAGVLTGATTFESTTYEFVDTDVGKILTIRGSTIPGNNVKVEIATVNVGSIEIDTALTIDAGPLAWEMRTPTAQPSNSDVTVRATSLITRLAYDFGIEVDTQENEDRQRSWVRNVSQWISKKGTAKGYEILASISGWDATPVALYRVDLSTYSVIPTSVSLQIGEAGAGRSGIDGTMDLIGSDIVFSSPIASFKASDVGLLIRIAGSATLPNDGLYEIASVTNATTAVMTISHVPILPEANNGALTWAIVRLYATVPPARPLYDDFAMDLMEALIDGYPPQTTNNFGLDVYCWEEGFDTEVGVVIDSVTVASPGVYTVVTSDGPPQGPSAVAGTAAVVSTVGRWTITDSTGNTLYLETTPVESGGTYSFSVASAQPLVVGAASLNYICTTTLSCGYCKSNRILLELRAASITNESGVAVERARERMISRLEDVTPTHVNLAIRFVQELEATLSLSALVCQVNALLVAPLTALYDTISLDIIVEDGTGTSTAHHTTDTEPDTIWTDLALTATIETP
jgi:hypothetical protein